MPDIQEAPKFYIRSDLPEYYSAAFYEGGKRLTQVLGTSGKTIESKSIFQRLADPEQGPLLRAALDSFIADGKAPSAQDKTREAAGYLAWLESKSEEVASNPEVFVSKDDQSLDFKGYLGKPYDRRELFMIPYLVENPEVPEPDRSVWMYKTLDPNLNAFLPQGRETIFAYLERQGGDGKVPLNRQEVTKAYSRHPLVTGGFNYNLDFYNELPDDGSGFQRFDYSRPMREDELLWTLKEANLANEVADLEQGVPTGFSGNMKSLEKKDTRILDLLHFLSDLSQTRRLKIDLNYVIALSFMRVVALRLAQPQEMPLLSDKPADIETTLPLARPWLGLLDCLQSLKADPPVKIAARLQQIFLAMRILEGSQAPEKEFAGLMLHMNHADAKVCTLGKRESKEWMLPENQAFWSAWKSLYQLAKASPEERGAALEKANHTVTAAFLGQWNHAVSPFLPDRFWPKKDKLDLSLWMMALQNIQTSAQMRYFWPEIKPLFAEARNELALYLASPNLFIPHLGASRLCFERGGKVLVLDTSRRRKGISFGYWNGFNQGFLAVHPTVKQKQFVFEDFYYYAGPLMQNIWDGDEVEEATAYGQNNEDRPYDRRRTPRNSATSAETAFDEAKVAAPAIPFAYFTMDFLKHPNGDTAYMRTLNLRNFEPGLKSLLEGMIRKADTAGTIEFPNGSILYDDREKDSDDKPITYRLGAF